MCIHLLSTFDYDFLSGCPSLKHGNGIHYVQYFEAMLDHWIFGFVQSVFHFVFAN